MVYVGGVRKGAFFIAFGKGIRDNLDQNGLLEIFGTNILNDSFSMPANKKQDPRRSRLCIKLYLRSESSHILSC